MIAIAMYQHARTHTPYVYTRTGMCGTRMRTRTDRILFYRLCTLQHMFICTSFTMQYCESSVYTTWESSAAETVKVAFQCRQLDGTYNIGQETIRAGSTRIDPLFNNNEVEWYTERIGSPVLYGCPALPHYRCACVYVCARPCTV